MPDESFLRAVGRVARARDGRIAIVGSLAIVLLVVQSGIGQFVLRTAGLSRAEAPYVELYFPDARSLPTTLPKSDRPRRPFRGGQRWFDHSQPCLAGHRGKGQGAARTRIWTLRSSAANRTKVISRTVRVQCPGNRALVEVAVEGSSARITLWLACRRHR